MSHMLKQCINFTNQFPNVKHHKSLVFRYNFLGNMKSTGLYCNKKNSF